MKINLKNTIISMIYIMTFILAIGQFRYQLYQQHMWYIVYAFSTLIISGLSVVYFIVFSHLRISKYSALLLGFIIYEWIVSLANGMGGSYKMQMVIDILPWPLLLALFYEYSSTKVLPKSFSFISIAGIFVCAILSIPNIQRHLLDYGRRGGVIFPVYFLIGQLGLILLIRKNYKNYLFMLLVSALLITSTKRAGTAAALGGIILYFFTSAYIAGTLSQKMKRFIGYFLGGLFVAFVGLYLIDYYNISIIERFMSVGDDAGSNRIFIWRDVMNHFYRSSLLQKIFGHGYHSVYYNVQPYGVARLAHNSFLEILYDYGIIGLSLLIIILTKIFLDGLKMIKRREENVSVLVYTLVPMLFLGVFSYFFEQTIIIVPFAIMWGIILGQYKRESCLD